MAFFRVRYSCRACGVDDAPVDVAERLPEQDVGDWMRVVVGGAVAADHATRGRGCTSGKADLKIPVPAGTARLGEKVRS